MSEGENKEDSTLMTGNRTHFSQRAEKQESNQIKSIVGIAKKRIADIDIISTHHTAITEFNANPPHRTYSDNCQSFCSSPIID